MAVANAFVMLGLLPESRAEAVLAEHRLALERRGLGNVWGVTKGELTVRPGAHEYWQARIAGAAGLREVPLLAAAAGVCCPTSAADMCFEWAKLTSAGLRLSFHATGAAPAGDPDPNVSMRQAMSEITLTGDTGRSFDLSVVRVAGYGRTGDRQVWDGHVLLAQDPASTPAWFELAPTNAGTSGRVALPAPAQVPVGPPRPSANRQVPGCGASRAGRAAAVGARHRRDRERLLPG